MSNPYTEILNQVLKALIPKLNGELGSEIKKGGLDPYPHVASGSESFGIGKASYSVTNLTGLSSLEFVDIVVNNVSGSNNSLSGDLAYHVQLKSNLSTNISGQVAILFAEPSISGSITISGATISGEGTFSSSTDGTKICLNTINVTSSNFNYADANAEINGAGIINDIIKPLENLILDAVKGDIRSLISGAIKSIFNQQANGLLPQCTNL